MAHLLEQEAQEEILEAGEEAAAEVEPLQQEAAAIAETEPLVAPPETGEAMAYRLGQLEARLVSQAEEMAALTALLQSQNREIAEAEAQLEIQEEVLAEVAEEESEEGHELPLWERLMGGSKRRKR